MKCSEWFRIWSKDFYDTRLAAPISGILCEIPSEQWALYNSRRMAKRNAFKKQTKLNGSSPPPPPTSNQYIIYNFGAVLCVFRLSFQTMIARQLKKKKKTKVRDWYDVIATTRPTRIRDAGQCRDTSIKPELKYHDQTPSTTFTPSSLQSAENRLPDRAQCAKAVISLVSR